MRRAIHEANVGRSAEAMRKELLKEIDTLELARKNDSIVIKAQQSELKLCDTLTSVLTKQRDNAEQRVVLYKDRQKKNKLLRWTAGGVGVVLAAIGLPAWGVAVGVLAVAVGPEIFLVDK